MNTAFCDFARLFHDPLLDEHTPEYLNMASKLCGDMPSAFKNEHHRRKHFEKIFLSLDPELNTPVEHTISPEDSTATDSEVMDSGARANAVKAIDFQGGSLVLLLQEFKVESTGDVYMQICREYEVLCGEEKNECLLEFGNPVFLLCILGKSWLSIPNNTL